jgi:hypothetical protein
MKKVFMYAGVLALTLTACSNEEILTPSADSGRAIEFGTLTAPSTRGPDFTTANLKESGNGFVVLAYSHGLTDWNNYMTAGLPKGSDGRFMDNTTVKWEAGAWTYYPAKYWPGKVNATEYGKLTLFARGGEAGGGFITYDEDAKTLKFDYNIPPSAEAQKDLVTATQFNQSWEVGKKVNFQFRHILSKIGFEAKLDKEYSGTTVKVTSLKVKYGAVKYQTRYYFNTDATDADGPGYWELRGEYTLNGQDSGELVATELNLPLPYDTALPLNRDNKFLMLIPDAISNVAGALTVNFSYEVKKDNETTTYEIPYQLPAYTYEMGKQYIYSFTFTLNPLEFDADIAVGDWDPDTNPDPIGL